MHKDVSPEIKTPWIAEKERALSEKSLLIQVSLLYELKGLSEGTNISAVRDNLSKYVNENFRDNDGQLKQETTLAIKGLMNQSILQYQEEIHRGQDLSIQAIVNNDEHEISTELLIPTKKEGDVIDLRLRIHGDQEELGEAYKKAVSNLFELRDMPDSIYSGDLAVSRLSLTKALEQAVGWDETGTRGTEKILTLITKTESGSQDDLKKLLEETKHKMHLWQRRSVLGLNSGSAGKVFSNLMALSIIEKLPELKNGYSQSDGEINITTDNGEFNIVAKFPAGEDSRDSQNYVEVVFSGNYKQVTKQLEALSQKHDKEKKLLHKLQSQNIKIGEVLKLGREYGVTN